MPRGDVVNLKVYQRIVTSFEVMRKWDAVGLSESILLDLRSNGVNLVRIVKVGYKDIPTQIFYVTVDAFLNSSLEYDYVKGDRNLFVPFSDMLLQTKSLLQQRLKV